MVSIKNQIISELITENIVSDVRDFYSNKKPVFPMITVQEFPTNSGIEIDGQPTIVTNYYEFEIYCKDSIISSVPIKANDMLFTLGLQLDEFLNEQYGMNQIGEPIILPYQDDNSVMRWVVRYSVIIDKSTLKTYRR